jgi:hypothetical protein
MSCWFLATSLPANYQGIFLFSGGVAIYVNPSGSLAWYGNTSVNAFLDPVPGTALSTNTWYNILLTMDASVPQVIFYLNGVVKSTTSTPAPASQSANMVVGYDAGSSGRVFNGRIAECSFWASTVLTQLEATSLARGVRSWMIRQAALGPYYPMDGLVSPEPDLSGNANNMTVTNTAAAFGPPIMQFTPRWPLVTPSPLLVVVPVNLAATHFTRRVQVIGY